eukprot:TRINITY_DN18992_c0_g1_i3.p1 TRINITY_DN18992_c0_g1~~TRINITY_DN18992_c0_g1_i3.p1  ORF type:complete len:312 (+),score=27.79 TRINITY_DN18992_c0_g1_i3:86-937(+)
MSPWSDVLALEVDEAALQGSSNASSPQGLSLCSPGRARRSCQNRLARSRSPMRLAAPSGPQVSPHSAGCRSGDSDPMLASPEQESDPLDEAPVRKDVEAAHLPMPLRSQQAWTQTSRPARPFSCRATSNVEAAAASWVLPEVAKTSSSARPAMDDEESDSELERRCLERGPPGPAGALRALPASGLAVSEQPTCAAPLASCISWLEALRAMKMPLDRPHLGLGGDFGAAATSRSWLALNNVATIKATIARRGPGHCRLLALVDSTRCVAGEMEVRMRDPTHRK